MCHLPLTLLLLYLASLKSMDASSSPGAQANSRHCPILGGHHSPSQNGSSSYWQLHSSVSMDSGYSRMDARGRALQSISYLGFWGVGEQLWGTENGYWIQTTSVWAATLPLTSFMSLNKSSSGPRFYHKFPDKERCHKTGYLEGCCQGWS